MKKSLLVTLCLSLFLTGCSETTQTSGNAETPETTTNTTPDTSTESIEHVSTGTPQVGDYMDLSQEAKSFPSLDGINVNFDLTKMSSTMSFAISSKMMFDPDEYWNKTFRVQGFYHYAYYEEFGDVHALLLLDDTLCCQAIIEFLLPEGAEYPENGAQIGLIGEYVFVDDPYVPYSYLDVSHFET